MLVYYLAKPVLGKSLRSADMGLSRSGFSSTARFHVKLPEEANKMIFFRNLNFKLARMKGSVGFNLFFTITAEILARSLANFYCQ